jgi:hypothetical protein
MKAEPQLSWNIPEYRKHKRGKKWYIVAVALLSLLLIYSVFSSNFLFAIILIIVSITMLLHDRKEAQEILCEIAENGITIGAKHYSYNLFKSFWLYYEPSETKMLFLEFKTAVRPRLSIPILNKNPLKIRALLLEHLTEDIEKENEPLSEQINRLLKL